MYDKTARRAGTFTAAALLLMACATSSQNVAQEAVAGSAGSVGAWQTLFDGTSMSAFRGYKSPNMPAGWSISNGELTKSGSVEDLVTREKFSNFELSFDWKLGPGGNGGVMYRVTEEYDHPYWSGPEYQLLDDAGHPDGKSRLTAAGSDYALYPSPAGVVKPANEWNSSLLVVQGDHVQHWMNGQKLLEYDLLSPDWTAKVKASKFGAWPNYGRATTGYIAIQGDHNGVLAMRNIKIRVLK